MLDFAFAEAVFGQLQFDGRVVEGGEFVMHGLHDFEALTEVVAYVLWSSEGGSHGFEGVNGRVEGGFLLNLVDAPGRMVEL